MIDKQNGIKLRLSTHSSGNGRPKSRRRCGRCDIRWSVLCCTALSSPPILATPLRVETIVGHDFRPRLAPNLVTNAGTSRFHCSLR